MSNSMESGNARSVIVEAAAKCFMQAGFSETSIDDVAEHLGATKGRIYHYYRSKAELFFDVHRHGMALNLSAIEPIVSGSALAAEKLSLMCRAHLQNMLDNVDY
ncbi:MAG: helix-turn-helix domain-containing protein, partial [Pseudomonadota bacterium]